MQSKRPLKSLFISEPARKHVNELLTKKPAHAAIAYVSDTEGILLGRGDLLVCDASDATAKTGGTTRIALRRLLIRGVTIKSLPNLHAKVLVAGDEALIGSANWSARSERLQEASIRTNDPDVVRGVRQFVLSPAKTQNAENVDKAFLDRMPEPVYAGRRPILSHAWLINVHQVIRLRKALKEVYDEAAKHAQEMGLSSGEKIEVVVYPSANQRAQEIDINDRIVLIWRAGGVEYVYPPSEVVGKMHIGDRVVVYYRWSKSIEDRGLSWTDFEPFARRAGLPARIGKHSERGLSDSQVEALIRIWPKRRVVGG